MGLPAWVANVYGIFAGLIVPCVLLLTMPLPIVSLIYLVTTICFGFVSMWFGVETFAALYLDSKKVPSDPCPAKTITYIIPAYMDNESVVLDETLKSYCELKFNGTIHVMVIYNSKRDMSKVEEEMDSKWNEKVFGNISISIIKNMNSTSKAENVNYGLSLVGSDQDYIAIMDADHQPAKDNASMAMSVIHAEKYDILQGACTIRNQDNFLSTLVSVEFADMYSVGHQGRLQVFNLGIFGGSNGYWKSEVLKKIQMDGSMLTEDIDSSIRATLAGYKIGYSGNVISSELSPLREYVLQKQRLRWAQGWAQVSAKYIRACIFSRLLTLRQKLGLVYLLSWRECFPYVTLWPLICVGAHIKSGNDLVFTLLITLSGAIIFTFGICRVAVTYRVAKGPIRMDTRAFVVFAFCNIFYSVYLNYIQICAHGRTLMRINAWNPTPREDSKKQKKEKKLAVVPVAPINDSSKDSSPNGSMIERESDDLEVVDLEEGKSDLGSEFIVSVYEHKVQDDSWMCCSAKV